MSKIIIAMLMLSAYAFGSDAEGSTDIVQRTVNFLIFAAILYYVLAEPLKNYFGGRSNAIASELEKVQLRLQESKQMKEAAEQKVEDAKRFASEIAELAKKENKLLSEKIMAQCEQDIETIQKQNTALMDLDQRKMVREVVEEVMAGVMTNATSSLGKDAMADILKKKVA